MHQSPENCKLVTHVVSLSSAFVFFNWFDLVMSIVCSLYVMVADVTV